MASHTSDPSFPCSLVISVPFPSSRLALSALRSLAVDEELSPLVRRSFTLENHTPAPSLSRDADCPGSHRLNALGSVLQIEYKATTNRMLRVAVNGLMESLNLILGIMEELDIDVLAEKHRKIDGPS